MCMHTFNSQQKNYCNIVYIFLVGFLSNGVESAIKLLKESQQGVIIFLNEVIFLINVKHKNFVTLKGSCLHGVLDTFLFTNVWEKKILLKFYAWGMTKLKIPL